MVSNFTPQVVNSGSSVEGICGGGIPGMGGGFLGVDVFFVLSGFLITSLLLDELGRTGRIRLTGFWIRRARRLLPALVLMVLAVGAARELLPAHDKMQPFRPLIEAP